MFTKKNKSLLPEIYNGHSGTHLTAYVPVTGGGLFVQKQEVDRVLQIAENLLKKEKSEDFVKDFLKPIRQFFKSPQILEQSRPGSWALFRTPKYLQLKRIPITLPKLSVISESFHVKPLLKWLQNRRECYALEIKEREACLYLFRDNQIKLISSMPLASSFKFEGDDSSRFQLGHKTLEWIDDWLCEVARDKTLSLLLVSKKDIVQRYRPLSKYPLILRDHVEVKNSLSDQAKLREKIKEQLNLNSKKVKKKNMLAIHRADLRQQVLRGLEEICKATVENKIRKLYIADDRHIWGVLNPEDGSFTLHPHQKDCRDDDILDDLAEIALRNGVEVVLLSKNEMPDNLPVLAIKKEKPPQAPLLLTGRVLRKPNAA